MRRATPTKEECWARLEQVDQQLVEVGDIRERGRLMVTRQFFERALADALRTEQSRLGAGYAADYEKEKFTCLQPKYW